jgi:hypothetical protein
MQLRQFIPDLFCDRCAEDSRQNSTEKAVAIPLARCARADRATAQPPASLILFKGVLPTPVENPPVSRALPVDNPATLTRGGRAYSPWAGAGTLAGACCVSGDTPAARRGSGLTLAGQPARTLDGARAEALSVWRPRLAPMPSAFTLPVCTAWTARPPGAHTAARCISGAAL